MNIILCRIFCCLPNTIKMFFKNTQETIDKPVEHEYTKNIRNVFEKQEVIL